MRNLDRFSIALAALLLAALACNLPQNQPVVTSEPNAAYTSAAQTVAAQLTQVAPPLASPTPLAPIPTNTQAPPPTPIPPPTMVQPTATQNCDRATFVDDVTIEDNTVMTQGQVFTKTWRLKNSGTCSWTPAYAVVFFSGEAMSGPAVQALTANVNPGQTVDISINLKAPATDGTYTGYWKLRNASGVTFTQFYVTIKVQSGPGSVNLTSLTAEDGQVRSTGAVLDNPVAGDTDANDTIQAFLSFDLSSIPNTATITKVVLDFASFNVAGDPFSISDGCLRAYVDDYGVLGAGDFFDGDPLGAVARWCSLAEMGTASEQPDLVAAVQSRLATDRLQLRLQFRPPNTNGNLTADLLRFLSPQIKVTYTP